MQLLTHEVFLYKKVASHMQSEDVFYEAECQDIEER